MPRSVASLAVSVTARTSKFAKGMKRAQRQLRQFSESARQMASRIAKYSTATAAAGAALATYFVRDQMKVVDALAKVSEKLGTTTSELAALHLASQLAGVEARTFNMALQRMTRRMAEAAAGGGEAKDAIAELGLNAVALARKSPTEALRKVADALRTVDNQSDRVRLAFKLFDSEGVAMINVLQGGSRALDEAARKAREFGLTVSGVGARQVVAANDAITELRASLEGVARVTAVQVSPYVEALADKLTDVTKHGRDLGRVIVDNFETMSLAAVEFGGRLINVGNRARELRLQLDQAILDQARKRLTAGRQLQAKFGIMADPRVTSADLATRLQVVQEEQRRISQAYIEINKAMDAVAEGTASVTAAFADIRRKAEFNAMRAEGMAMWDDLSRGARSYAENLARTFRMHKYFFGSAAMAPEAVADIVRKSDVARMPDRITRFVEVDLSRTLVSGLTAARRQKQKVQDDDALRELRLIRQNTARGTVATVAPG